MSEFKKVEKAVFGPRSCALCGSFEGPFADTELDIVPYGHIYLCLSTPRRGGCVRQLSKLDSMVPLELAEEKQRAIEALTEQIVELESRVLEVVPLRDVREAMVSGVLQKEE